MPVHLLFLSLLSSIRRGDLYATSRSTTSAATSGFRIHWSALAWRQRRNLTSFVSWRACCILGTLHSRAMTVRMVKENSLIGSALNNHTDITTVWAPGQLPPLNGDSLGVINLSPLSVGPHWQLEGFPILHTHYTIGCVHIHHVP